MNDILQEVFDLPPELRFDYAVELIRVLTCDDVDRLARIMKVFDIPRQPALLLNFLLLNAGSTRSKEQIFRAIYPIESDATGESIDVAMVTLRKNTRDFFSIETVWGVGYYIEKSQALLAEELIGKGVVPDFPRKAGEEIMENRRGIPWTPEEDENLINMLENGSTPAAICEDLGRTIRGVGDRIRILGLPYVRDKRGTGYVKRRKNRNPQYH